MEILSGIMLSDFTTYKIGGPADYFIKVDHSGEMINALQWAWSKNLPFKILGKGSNVLISDKGFRGLIIYNTTNTVKIQSHNESATLFADSGVILDDLAKKAANKGWQGLEWAVGIPGTVGGAVLTNAGTSAGNIASSLEWITIFHKEEGLKVRHLDELNMGYRTSLYKTDPQLLTMEGIISAQFRMTRGDKIELAEIITKRLERRKLREPVEPNAGSIFKNPGNLSVRTMVDECGLSGFQTGGAEIPGVAPSFIINKNNASAEDVLQLIALIKKTIYEKHQLILEPEVELIGQWSPEQVELVKYINSPFISGDLYKP